MKGNALVTVGLVTLVTVGMTGLTVTSAEAKTKLSPIFQIPSKVPKVQPFAARSYKAVLPKAANPVPTLRQQQATQVVTAPKPPAPTPTSAPVAPKTAATKQAELKAQAAAKNVPKNPTPASHAEIPKGIDKLPQGKAKDEVMAALGRVQKAPGKAQNPAALSAAQQDMTASWRFNEVRGRAARLEHTERQMVKNWLKNEQGSQAIAGVGANKPLWDIQRITRHHEGTAADWSKMTSRPYTLSTGQKISAHWLQNRVGKTVELKPKDLGGPTQNYIPSTAQRIQGLPNLTKKPPTN